MRRALLALTAVLALTAPALGDNYSLRLAQNSGCQQCKYLENHCHSNCYYGNTGGLTSAQCHYKCSVAGTACTQRFCGY